MNVNILKSPLNLNTPSFGASLSAPRKIAEKIVNNYAREGFLSGTDLKDVRFPHLKTKSDISRVLAMLVIAKTQAVIFSYRQALWRFAKGLDNNECAELLLKLINNKNIRALNCGECGFLAHYELAKKGIPSRVVYDSDIDHCFVIANRTKPFTSYKDAEKGEFVADIWGKKVYKSVQEAYVDFKSRFDAKIDTVIEDRTETNPYKFYNNKSNGSVDVSQTVKKQDEEFIKNKVYGAAEKIQKVFSYFVRDIKTHPQRYEHKINGRLINEFLEEMSEYINQAGTL